jgi:hypothetical protein
MGTNMITSLSIGAVGAAIVAAIISLVGLIVTKEQKISEFRQQWIDSLRTEITNYLTNINAISDALGVPYGNQTEKVKALSDLYSELNRSHFMITLRLNEEERFSAAVLGCMKDFTDLSGDETNFRSAEQRKSIEKRFLVASKLLLKHEWNRVKKGEPSFIIAKYVTLLSIAACSLLFILSYALPVQERSCLGGLCRNIYETFAPFFR